MKKIELSDHLKENRDKLDKLDYKIIALLDKRFKFVKQIAKIKKRYNIPINQRKRINEVLNKRIEIGRKFNINHKFIRNIFKLLINESIKIQKNLLNNDLE
ncbi:MAG: hypothetical protein ACD_79C00311G0008 [uncultured bacterium]|nr:MAG: hypothetical protein ACD_79C00311G0008 [uncultured bacterium]